MACICDAGYILVFVIVDSKGEGNQRLKRNNLRTRMVGIEALDKMTDRQIAARVWKYFQK